MIYTEGDTQLSGVNYIAMICQKEKMFEVAFGEADILVQTGTGGVMDGYPYIANIMTDTYHGGINSFNFIGT